jgi:hypothetical protein
MRFKKRLQTVANAKHTAWAPAIGKSAQEGGEGNARDKLNESNQQACGGSAIAKGENQERYPDTKLSYTK